MWSCDPRRFTAFTDPDYCVAKGMEVYGHEYAIHFPRHTWPAGRNKKLSPIHDRIAKLGAQFRAYNGWERANWYAQAGRRHVRRIHADLPARRTRGSSVFAKNAMRCAMLSAFSILPGFSRFKVKRRGRARHGCRR